MKAVLGAKSQVCALTFAHPISQSIKVSNSGCPTKEATDTDRYFSETNDIFILFRLRLNDYLESVWAAAAQAAADTLTM
jgi:hypothetical protein